MKSFSLSVFQHFSFSPFVFVGHDVRSAGARASIGPRTVERGNLSAFQHFSISVFQPFSFSAFHPLSL
jgi:hypothetical protein